MACGTGSAVTSYSVQYFYNPNCSDCTSGCSSVLSSSCVFYAGPNLACSGILTDDSLETALQKIDLQICSVIGEYSEYQFNCLIAWWGNDIIDEGDFVDAITGYACAINTNLTTFTGTTFVNYQAEVTADLLALQVPGIICSAAGVTDTDTLVEILNKCCTLFGTIQDDINVTNVTWDSCFTVPSAPSTIAEGFDLLADQICQVKTIASGGSLPTFNNYGSCIGGASSDSLVTTIGLIKTRLCTAGVFNINDVEWGCLDDSATNLQTSVQTIIDQVSVLVGSITTYSNDFIITANGDSCDGITVALATPINQDRLVAANAADNSPGTLIDKLVGVGITVNDSINPGQITLTSTATSDDFTVKANISDTTADYLDNKIGGATGTGIIISPSYNVGTEKVDIIPSVDLSVLFDALLDQLLIDTDLYTKFCARVANCPSPCAAPTNVQVVQASTSTTTTTSLP